MKKKLLLGLALIAVPLATIDAQGQEVSLSSIKSWRCAFPLSASADWRSDYPDPEIEQQDMTFNIDNVDIDENTARLIGNSGSADISAFGFLGGVNLFEQTPAGSFNITTIYDASGGPLGGRPSFKAVHSRHSFILGPLPSQAYGFCVPWE